MFLQSQPKQCTTPPMQDKTKTPYTLLYVEDNSANLILVEQIISRRGELQLLTARNGRQGIQVARDYHPDAIILDINLPDINGIEVLRILRATPALSDIPVMALSSNAFPLQIERGLQEGFFRYLTKPFQINEFSLALDALLIKAS
jgi:CheY-like chemotaxis protein